ncbi:hypothetical protein M0802_010934 [Mischocyttarus mexicanus]|nr:hypothetical protein M0802_010975 [Mischocyttarus mexicanus]KAI4489624.1 hypothetical protein M0802_010934 [Mischocyttarus mexicanus]
MAMSSLLNEDKFETRAKNDMSPTTLAIYLDAPQTRRSSSLTIADPEPVRPSSMSLAYLQQQTANCPPIACAQNKQYTLSIVLTIIRSKFKQRA